LTLADTLARARSEEDVKDAYVRAIGLKGVSKGLVDIQTKDIWFEAKCDPKPVLAMFAQLLFYVRQAHATGQPIPPFLAVVDKEKAAILETELARPVLNDEAIAWPASASAVGKSCIAQVAGHIEGHFTTYRMATDEKAFVAAVKAAISEGRIIRTPITRDNLRQAFNKWEEMVGRELGVPEGQEGDYAELFFADIMHDEASDETAMNGLSARLGREGGTPVFYLKRGKAYERFQPASLRGYRNFWRIYDRPPAKKDRDYLLERRDMLLPIDEQKFKGAYYTPPHIVDKAYDLLTATLGEGWQEKYIIWDMCCGVGNLELSHSNPRNLFMSTLDQPDIDNIHVRGLFPGATIFQYDYLNDDVTDFGEIDYILSDKVPKELRQAIADAKAGAAGAKPILVLINPPYAEAMNVDNMKEAGSNAALKKSVAAKRISYSMGHLGYATRELFVQFLHRIRMEIPTARLAMFSTLKYVNAPNFVEFRKGWTAKYLGGFIVHNRAFKELKGNFPIGFLLWDLGDPQPAQSLQAVALDADGNIVGEKLFYRVLPRAPLPDWIVRARSNAQPAVPLKNALTPTSSTKDVRGTRWADGAIGSLIVFGNDFQHAATTGLLSSGYGNAGALFVTGDNLEKAAIVFSVRRLIKPTWLNDRDQFLQPSEPLTHAFKSDCLVWMLFNGSNLTAGADGLRWNDRDWSLVNHFIPFTEGEVGAKGRFESDFMVRHMKNMAFSPEARGVLEEGRKLWAIFHVTQFPHTIRDEFKLGRPDAGWYQIRRALKANAETGLTDFEPFETAYAAMTAKLRPMVYELGFLPA
jgi:hypothetical protein